jgi:uncharacterized membrane protein HdeD (DUF308 family)
MGDNSMQDLRMFWWVFAFRGGFALLFAALLYFTTGLLGTIFFDPVMLVSLSLLLGFFILANGLLLGVAAVFSREHHLRLWYLLSSESVVAIALGAYITSSLMMTSHSLAYLAGLHAVARVFFQVHLGIKLRRERSYAPILFASAAVSVAMALFFFAHREDTVRTITAWLSGYEALYGIVVVAFAIGLHRQPRTLFAATQA